MRDPRKFGLVLDLAYSTATAISAIFGMCAYYIWGPETAAVVATNLPSGPGANQALRVACVGFNFLLRNDPRRQLALHRAHLQLPPANAAYFRYI